MTTSKVAVTEGSGTNLATYSFTEDAVTKHASRVTVVDTAGAEVMGSKTDDKSTATDTTATSAVSIWKQISASIQTLAGAVSSSKVATKAAAADFADGAIATIGLKADAKSTATDTTAVSGISIWKQISASVQAIATSIAGSLTVSGSLTTVSTVTSLTQLNGAAISMGTGVRGAGVQRVTIATDDVVPITNTPLTNFGAGEWETVAASQTTQSLGATGGIGDYISGILVVPGTTSPGNVLLRDGAGSDITVFTGGSTSVSNLVPFFIPLGMISLSGAWKVTTGANVTCIGIGNFT